LSYHGVIERCRTARLALVAAILLAACGEDPLGPEPFREPLADITANGHTTCALTVSGKAYCWGRGDNGQLGNGGARDEFAPVPVRTSLRFASISAGYYHTCALTDLGEAWCWGANRRQEGSGQIGNGSRVGGEEPERVRTSLRFSQITAGQVHTCALTQEGEAYCWGGNWYGQLGDGTTTDRTRPVAVGGGLRFVHLSAGTVFTCGATVQGAGYCWGSNYHYRLGTGEQGEHCGPSDFACSSVPLAIASGQSFVGVTAGEAHACAWTTGGMAYCWGSNLGGQIGRGDTVEAAAPAEVTGGHGFAALEVGTGISCGLNLAGAPYCWGSNRLGQVGNSGATDDGSSVPLSVGGGLRMRTLAAGMFHVCGVTETGIAYCWGSNRRGELGVGDAQLEICDPTNGHPCSRTPVRVEGQDFAAAATAPQQ